MKKATEIIERISFQNPKPSGTKRIKMEARGMNRAKIVHTRQRTFGTLLQIRVSH